MATLGKATVLATIAVFGVAADVLVIAGGFSLLSTQFSASDLAQSGLSQGAVTLHARVLITLGLLPTAGLLIAGALKVRALLVQRQRVRRQGERSGNVCSLNRLIRVALIATCTVQGIAILGAAASTL